MSEFRGYNLDWSFGPSAQLDIFAGSDAKRFQLKFTPPTRSTIRPSARYIDLPDDQLDLIREQASALMDPHNRGRHGRTEEDGDQTAHLTTLGRTLARLLLSRSIEVSLRRNAVFLEIGLDSALLSYPWELLHDGVEFYCLTHDMSRFINSRSDEPSPVETFSWWNARQSPLEILIIGVAAPNHPGLSPLHHVETETRELGRLLGPVSDVNLTLLVGREATQMSVMAALSRSSYHLIHFCGHVSVNDADPLNGRLVLHDSAVPIELIAKLVEAEPPILFFLNGSEGHRVGLPLLKTGASLIGTTGAAEDKESMLFARAFYSSLLIDQKPLGRAVRDARISVRQADSYRRLGWIKYVLYGDPRIMFRRAYRDRPRAVEAVNEDLEDRLAQRIANQLRGPDLDNYVGFVCAQLFRDDGHPLTTDGDGLPCTVAGRVCILFVWMQPDQPNGVFVEPVSVRDGRDSGKAAFELLMESDTLQFALDRHAITVKTGLTSPKVPFECTPPMKPGVYECWVQLYQKNRLLQALRVQVRVLTSDETRAGTSDA
jgi:hypothetical protein